MDAQPRLESTGALCALVQALARLELEEEGYAPRALVHAQEALARPVSRADGVAAELIDPGACAPRTNGDLLADLTAAMPHAAWAPLTKTGSVAALVAAPEAARQEVCVGTPPWWPTWPGASAPPVTGRPHHWRPPHAGPSTPRPRAWLSSRRGPERAPAPRVDDPAAGHHRHLWAAGLRRPAPFGP